MIFVLQIDLIWIPTIMGLILVGDAFDMQQFHTVETLIPNIF